MRKIILAGFISELGDWAGLIAVMSCMTENTGGYIGIGSLFALKALSVILGGYLVPVFRRLLPNRIEWRLAIIDCLKAAALLPLLLNTPGPLQVLCAYLLVALLSISFDAELATLVKATTDSTTLTETIAKLEGAARLALVFGPALMAFVVHSLGIKVGLALDIASFIISGLVVLSAAANRSLPQSDAQDTPPRLALLEAFRFAPSIQLGLLASFLLSIGFGLVNTVELPYALTELGLTTSAFGWMVTVCGLGGLIGARYLTRLLKLFSPSTLTAGGYAIGGAFIFSLVLTRSFPLVLIALCLYGFFSAIASISFRTIFTSNVAGDSVIGVMSARAQIIQLGFAVGALMTEIPKEEIIPSLIMSSVFHFAGSLVMSSKSIDLLKRKPPAGSSVETVQ